MWNRGYTGAGAKQLSQVKAKISMRLVPNQEWEHITEIVHKTFHEYRPIQ
jgi:hypothetical protein